MATGSIYVTYYLYDSSYNFFYSKNHSSPHIGLTFEWTVKSQDVVKNTSTVDWVIKASDINLANFDSLRVGWEPCTYMIFGTDVSPSIGGVAPYYDIDIKVNSNSIWNTLDWSATLNVGEVDKTIATGTFTITHNSDGTFSAPISCWIRGKNVYNANGENGFNNYGKKDYGEKSIAKLDGTITLPTIIPYGVLDSAPNFNDEQNPTITYTIPNGVNNVVAYLSFSGQTETITPRPVDLTKTSYTFNFTDEEREILRSILSQGTATKQVTFHLRSTTGGRVYYSSKNATLSIINYTPTLSPVVYDTNATTKALTNDQYVLVNGLSSAYYNSGATGRKGATIVSQTVKNGDVTKNTATGTFETVTSPEFYFRATDSFGRSVTADYNLPASNWIPYVKITCSAEFTDMTADGDLTITLKGKFYEGKFGAKGKTNRMRVNYDITEGESEDFTHVDLGYADLASNYGNSFTVNGNDYTYVINIKNQLDYTKSYSFRIRVSDEVSVTPAEVASVVSPTPIFDWSRTDFNFNVPVTIQGGSVPTIVAQGTAGIWTYRTWSDGTAECWGKKDVSVTFPSTANWGGLYTTGAISGSNISFPFGLFAETPVVNASLLIRSSGGILMAPGGAGSNIANMDQTGVYEIARGSYVSGTQYYTINYDVKGRWK